ncbi:uncharacterized protein STEHIDRAFT_161044 [Stereum hirsutum FP-91666 SS1]|uniref:uncharacterized protein n=1 Tax=Stereum hirsutum (strain FP-91666) TaxID=721885 RepID=UPI0004449E50|nr:uncharacterized protein STEHIDRAFT_161044 [Stereum hirsutum FP-91666 SS1]EIM82507.1 hypothetical protein STEHIDRAFT_161044 [Stereum hirsutum FP-91666 SS1]
MSDTQNSQDALDAVVLSVSDTRAVNLASGAALAWLVYDVIDQIWRSKWSKIKILYLFARYYVLFTLAIHVAVNTNTTVSLKLYVSERWFWFRGFNGPFISTVLAESLFAIRIWALYQQSRKILVLIFVALSIEVALSAVFICLEVSSLTVIERPLNFPIPGCLATSPNDVKLSTISW